MRPPCATSRKPWRYCRARSTTTSPPRRACWSPCTRRAPAASTPASRRRWRNRRRAIPGSRLSEASAAYLESMLGVDRDLCAVIIAEFPRRHSKTLRAQLLASRQIVEDPFRKLVADAAAAPGHRPQPVAAGAAGPARLDACLVPQGQAEPKRDRPQAGRAAAQGFGSAYLTGNGNAAPGLPELLPP